MSSPGATINGDGGKVIVWADDTTRAYGRISARGGVDGGNGGLIETSGKIALDVAGSRVDASASKGSNGQWLLDPSNVTVVHGTSGALTGGLFDPASSSNIGDAQINTALNNGTDVTIQTSAGTGGTGLIVVNGSADSGGAVAISNTSGGARSLNMSTAGTINIHAGATMAGSTGNALNVTLSATGGNTIFGTIDNSGGTTTLTGASALNGTIRNGTLVSTDGAPLTANYYYGTAILDGVTFGSNLNVNGYFSIYNDLTLANGISVNQDDGSWYFSSAGTRSRQVV